MAEVRSGWGCSGGRVPVGEVGQGICRGDDRVNDKAQEMKLRHSSRLRFWISYHWRRGGNFTDRRCSDVS